MRVVDRIENLDMEFDIYSVGNRVMNTYVYHTSAGYIMIDTGYEQN